MSVLSESCSIALRKKLSSGALSSVWINIRPASIPCSAVKGTNHSRNEGYSFP
uniref:Uncharacterized protein n=1 Tax=Arundo donax TaxID=35708 RepID=A0A0A9CDK7_ARUDO